MSHPPTLPKLARLAWLGYLLCLLAGTALAQTAVPRHRVLIDRSGSMEGFFNAGSLDDVQRLLADLSGAAGDTYYFIDLELVPAGQAAAGYGASTHLTNALDRARAQHPAPSILWLLTDNQPSVGNQTDSDRDIAQLYDRLSSDLVKRLYFFPLKLDFSGKLYRDDGRSVLKPDYRGKRGLLLYALLLNESAREEFERVTASFQMRYRPAAGEMRRILIKPLEQDTVTARLIHGDKFRVERESQLVAGDFAEGAPINGKFAVELTSQLGQMKIRSADIDVRVPEKFKAGDFTVAEITPTFSPKVITDFEPQNQRRIDVELNAPGVEIRKNPVTLWNCITKNRGEITGNVEIRVKAQGQNFDVVSSLANEYSTNRDVYNDASEGVQSRIYKLDGLVKQMLPDQQVEISPQISGSAGGVIPVRLVVRYPKWPLVALLVIIAALIALTLLLWSAIGRAPLYRLTWDGGRFRACPDFRLWPFVGRSIELDNRTAATIKKSLGGIRVRAAGGYEVDDTRGRLLNPGGTDFNVSQSADGAGVNFYFSTTTAAFSGGAGARGEDDGILGGVAYGGAADAREATAASAAPPIRKPSTARVASGGGHAGSSGDATEDDDDKRPVSLDDLFP